VPSLLNVDTTTVINFGPVDGESDNINGVSTFEDDKWHFGIGLGFGYQITQQISADVSYQNFENVETLTLAAKYRF
jgi:opacity protein-like surface antigen